MTLVEAKAKLARAITNATNEHGWPNSFSFGELADSVGLSPMLAGRVFESVRDEWNSRHSTATMGRTHDGRVAIILRDESKNS